MTEDHRLVGFDAWGWGFAGVSFFFGTPERPGWAYLNHLHIDDYFKSLDANRFPVERGFHYTITDLRLNLLFQELQGMTVQRATYQKLFRVDILAEHRAVWEALAEREWVRIDEREIRVVGDGVFYTPLIQNVLAHDRLEAMRKGA
jgi:oxygen-independent coproporphyrinogen-3 oxidase